LRPRLLACLWRASSSFDSGRVATGGRFGRLAVANFFTKLPVELLASNVVVPRSGGVPAPIFADQVAADRKVRLS
jgi:hypothetical protein